MIIPSSISAESTKLNSLPSADGTKSASAQKGWGGWREAETQRWRERETLGQRHGDGKRDRDSKMERHREEKETKGQIIRSRWFSYFLDNVLKMHTRFNSNEM